MNSEWRANPTSPGSEKSHPAASEKSFMAGADSGFLPHALIPLCVMEGLENAEAELNMKGCVRQHTITLFSSILSVFHPND